MNFRNLNDQCCECSKKQKRSQDPTNWESFTNVRIEYHQKVLAAKTKDNGDNYNLLASNAKKHAEKVVVPVEFFL